MQWELCLSYSTRGASVHPFSGSLNRSVTSQHSLGAWHLVLNWAHLKLAPAVPVVHSKALAMSFL